MDWIEFTHRIRIGIRIIIHFHFGAKEKLLSESLAQMGMRASVTQLLIIACDPSSVESLAAAAA